jgi:hypothetical protein
MVIIIIIIIVIIIIMKCFSNIVLHIQTYKQFLLLSSNVCTF